MRSKEALAETTDPRWISVRGMVRRMVVSLTNAVKWQLTGVPLPDGNGGVAPEVRSAEVFSGIGFFSRPPKTGAPEAAVLSLGGDASAPLVVATRDEKTRAEVAGDLDEDETITFNSSTIVYNKKNGTVEIRTPSGTAVELALKSDVEAVDQKYANHLHGAAGAPTTGPLAAFTPGTPPVSVPLPPAQIVGTTVLKAQ